MITASPNAILTVYSKRELDKFVIMTSSSSAHTGFTDKWLGFPRTGNNAKPLNCHVLLPDRSPKLGSIVSGTTRVIGWIGLMVGIFIYNRFAHVALSLITLLDIVLVTRLNVALGVSDKTLMLFGSAISDAINQFKFMPFLILSGHLCPPGIEGTLFALLMSINNLGATISGFLGAGLASVLNISSGSFDNLSVGIAIQVVCALLPVGFLFLIPEQATGVSA